MNGIPFKVQVDYFKEVANLLRDQLGEADAKELMLQGSTIYYSSIGGVDLSSLISTAVYVTESMIQDYVKIVIGNITDAV
ncbi:hypothetical protein SLEP1_g54574 [Rubroshorea leprosula]|uniref:Uncharacterized protein n=1 Tax=Rubroshorea leprosula TaxID=152421 RepID=A0AAV5MD59_9ROSI|nr:hypothetical protein SLEP1_g54574 [Rubroshorea leprosula]